MEVVQLDMGCAALAAQSSPDHHHRRRLNTASSTTTTTVRTADDLPYDADDFVSLRPAPSRGTYTHLPTTAAAPPPAGPQPL